MIIQIKGLDNASGEERAALRLFFNRALPCGYHKTPYHAPCEDCPWRNACLAITEVADYLRRSE